MNEFARTIVNTNIVYLKASADIKISTFWRKMGGQGWGSQNGPLSTHLKRVKSC